MSRTIPFEKSFASSDKAQFWSSRNVLKPEQFTISSGKKCWFDCNKCEHTFDKKLDNIAKGSWCPYCASKLLCDDNNCNKCYDKSFASSDKANYWSDRNRDQPEGYDGLYLKPREVFKSSNKKYWFDCNKCGHTFDSTLASITNGGSWCPYCANQELCDDINCNHCFEKSFASSENSMCWSDKNELNPRDVFKSSGNEYLFVCYCGHTFVCQLDNIAKGNWCPYCSNPPKQLCDSNDCKQCFEKSFASSDKANYWSRRNILKPKDVFKSSDKKYWFDCNVCGHTFDTKLSTITRGSWCPYCSNPPKQLCDSNDCKQCFEKSFVSSDKANYWSSRNELKQREVFKSSNSKFWFNCDNGHEFKQILSLTTCGKWCPYCVNKTEQILYDKLITLYPSLQQQFKSDWCKKKQHLPFDFVIPERNIIIELDGRQHFEQVSNWSSPEETQENDKYKTECANQNNYSVIRLLQEDVFYNTYNWFDELNQNIQKIISEGLTQNIYMCKNNEYEADVL